MTDNNQRKIDPATPNRDRFKTAIQCLEERNHINALFNAQRALIEHHGWKEIIYAPKDGTPFEVITTGSIGIFSARWLGEKNDLLFVEDGGDLWPARAILFRIKPTSKPGDVSG
jgi:hypothetical protein